MKYNIILYGTQYQDKFDCKSFWRVLSWQEIRVFPTAIRSSECSK